MGLRLLDQLWDDTVAGPQPDSGLGKLRKHKTFSFRSSSATGSSDGRNVRSYGENSTEEVKVTRSIMIVKPPGYGSGDGVSARFRQLGSRLRLRQPGLRRGVPVFWLAFEMSDMPLAPCT